MDHRAYRLGKRQAKVDRTRGAILAAARDLVVEAGSSTLSVGAVARRAAVSRITVYQHFGSKAALIQALAGYARAGVFAHRPAPDEAADARDQLRRRITDACTLWASDPALFRHLPTSPLGGERGSVSGADPAGWGRQDENRLLAERLAASDQLRPGCSLKEAEDVIGMLTSFPPFDRLAKDGRRAPSAVSEILMRLAAAILVR